MGEPDPPLSLPRGGLPLDFGKPFGRFGPHFTGVSLGPRDRLGLRDLLFLWAFCPRCRAFYRKGEQEYPLPPSPWRRTSCTGGHRGGGRVGVGRRGGSLALLLSHAHPGPLRGPGLLAPRPSRGDQRGHRCHRRQSHAGQRSKGGWDGETGLPEPPHPEGGRAGIPGAKRRGLPAGVCGRAPGRAVQGRPYTESQVKANLHDLLSQHPGPPSSYFAPTTSEHLLSALRWSRPWSATWWSLPRMPTSCGACPRRIPLWGLVLPGPHEARSGGGRAGRRSCERGGALK